MSQCSWNPVPCKLWLLLAANIDLVGLTMPLWYSQSLPSLIRPSMSPVRLCCSLALITDLCPGGRLGGECWEERRHVLSTNTLWNWGRGGRSAGVGWRGRDLHSYGEDWQHLQAQKAEICKSKSSRKPARCPHAFRSPGLLNSML